MIWRKHDEALHLFAEARCSIRLALIENRPASATFNGFTLLMHVFHESVDRSYDNHEGQG